MGDEPIIWTATSSDLSLKNWKNYLKTIYSERAIIGSLIRKSFFGKYKNSYLGVFWQFITPLMILIMYIIFFEGGIRTGRKEFMWIFLATAVFPFNFIRMNVIGGSSCFTSNSGYIKKMYIPMSFFVFVHVAMSLIVFIITLLGLMIAMAIVGYSFNMMAYLWVIPYVFVSIIFSIGCCLIFSTINVFIRDTQHALSAIGVSLFFLTPILRTTDEATGLLHTIMVCNPLTYFVEPFRIIMYDCSVPGFTYMIICSILSLLCLVSGVFLFNKCKNKFAERL